MIKQVQGLPLCLQPPGVTKEFLLGDAVEEPPWRKQEPVGLAWDEIVQQSSQQAVLPAHRPRFPGRQPGPAPPRPPTPNVGCVRGGGTGAGGR